MTTFKGAILCLTIKKVLKPLMGWTMWSNRKFTCQITKLKIHAASTSILDYTSRIKLPLSITDATIKYGGFTQESFMPLKQTIHKKCKPWGSKVLQCWHQFRLNTRVKRVYIQKWPKLQSLNVCQHLCMLKVYTCQVQVCNAGTKTGKPQEVQGTHWLYF